MVRQAHLIAVVLAFLIGCAFLLMAGASGVRAEASKKEEARCEETRTIKPAWAGGVDIFTTNDLPGCPKGGLLLGTDKNDNLAGQDGNDTIRGLGGSDWIEGGSGDDVFYGGDGDDFLGPEEGNDVMYGGDGNDELASNDGSGPDKLYCGKGRDTYNASKPDYVDSSCEVASGPPSTFSGDDVAPFTSSASASPVPLPQSGGPAILLLAAALLFGSGILTYAILKRR